MALKVSSFLVGNSHRAVFLKSSKMQRNVHVKRSCKNVYMRMHFSQELQVVVIICGCNFPYQRYIICLEFIRRCETPTIQKNGCACNICKINCECNLAMRCMCMQLFLHTRFFYHGCVHIAWS